MKLNKEKPQDFSVGDQRTKTYFALFPTYTEEDAKGRWLERVTVLQEMAMEMNYGSMDFSVHKGWKNIRFIDKKESK